MRRCLKTLRCVRCECVTLCGFQVMKRVRTEQIQYAVAQYLKRRQYVDTDGSLKGAKLFQSAEEMAASLTGESAAQVEVMEHCVYSVILIIQLHQEHKMGVYDVMYHCHC